MRALFQLILGATVFVATATTAAAADSYPSRPIRIIVNSGAGGLLDVVVRLVAQHMGEELGQSIVVENRTGADGLIGIRVVKSAPADGYTLLASANTVAQAPAFKGDVGYSPVKDFVGIGMVDQAPMIMVGPAAQRARTLAEFIAEAKANPKSLSVASGGVGTSTHMAAALFMQQAGIQLLHVPYKGNAGALPDVMGGRVHAIFDGANTSGPAIREGRLRAFGITSPKRSPAFPAIPTLAEQGLPNYSFYAWHGLLAPAGTPQEVVKRLNQALQRALSDESVRARLRSDGAEPGAMTSEEFTEFVRQDAMRTMKVVSELQLPKE